MATPIIPIIAVYPASIDYSLIGMDFKIIQTYKDGEQPAPLMILNAAKQKIESFFGGTATIEESTGKVSLSVSGVNRAKAEAYLAALNACINFIKI